MPKTVIPAGYRPALGLYDTQKAIGLIKQIFLEKLCGALHLKRVTAPLFVDPATGLNDDLNGGGKRRGGAFAGEVEAHGSGSV